MVKQISKVVEVFISTVSSPEHKNNCVFKPDTNAVKKAKLM